MRPTVGILVLVCSLGCEIQAQTAAKIVDHGPDGEKLVFVVLGDGYSVSEQDQFASDVDNLVVKGVFAHDFYKDNFAAFNVYRVDLISEQSGVSTPGAPKNTALGIVFNGQWSQCYFDQSPNTDALITKAISISKVDFVVIVANEEGYGGCRRGSQLYVTRGDSWDVVAHEYGHALAGLYDEYSVKGHGVYAGERINDRNCSVVLDRQKVVWSKLIDKNTAIPSDDLQNIDSTQTVGEFTGCNYAEKEIFRPVMACRMNLTSSEFCPVCLAAMKAQVQPFLTGAHVNARHQAGLQPGAQGAPPPQIGKFVSMLVDLDIGGKLKIVKAGEVSGTLIQSQAASPVYIATLSSGKGTRVAGLFVDDPFVERGFRDPEHPEKGEFLAPLSSATVTLNMPQTTLLGAMRNMSLQLYNVSLAARTSDRPEKPLNSSEIKQMLETGELKKIVDVSSKTLGDQIKSLAIK